MADDTKTKLTEKLKKKKKKAGTASLLSSAAARVQPRVSDEPRTSVSNIVNLVIRPVICSVLLSDQNVDHMDDHIDVWALCCFVPDP